ncbi:response regulator [soil metagenome]
MSIPKARVLIVDDIPEQRDIHATLLRFSGYEVIEAENGQEALRMVREHTPDVVIMDVMLPVLDGWAATERIKADPATARLPVLILTARALKHEQARSQSAGADAYLSKPCNPTDVLHEVERLLRSHPASAAE